MIETEQTILINSAIDRVWDYARDIKNWASIMPGYQDCTIIDENASRWTLKVGVGGLVRTVNVAVNVDQWDGPERVFFTYKLEGDPVKGGGRYTAVRKGAHETEVALQVRVEGTGPMAPMWEAMGGPLLPKFARSFAAQLKTEIEKASMAPMAETPVMQASASPIARFFKGLGRFWLTLRNLILWQSGRSKER